jgi:hypothetical protein
MGEMVQGMRVGCTERFRLAAGYWPWEDYREDITEWV